MATGSQMYPDQDMSQKLQQLEELVNQQAEQIQALSKNISKIVTVGSGVSRSSVGNDQYGPFLSIYTYTGGGEERTVFRLLDTRIDTPSVEKTTSDGSTDRVWQG